MKLLGKARQKNKEDVVNYREWLYVNLEILLAAQDKPGNCVGVSDYTDMWQQEYDKVLALEHHMAKVIHNEAQLQIVTQRALLSIDVISLLADPPVASTPPHRP